MAKFSSIFLISLVCQIFLFQPALVNANIFQLGSISVTGNNRLSNEAIVNYARLRPNTNLSSEDLNTAYNKILDTGLFKNDFEKNLYKKIQDTKKYLSNFDKNVSFEDVLNELFKFKQDVNLFFDNVKVNDENELIKKNRLELLNLLCKSFDNFFNFSKIES